MIRGLILATLAAFAAAVHAERIPGVTHGLEAYLVMPAKPIEGLAEQATKIQWTESGKGLLIWHRPPIKREFYERQTLLKLRPDEITLPPQSLTLWDRARNRLYPVRGFENLGTANATFSYAQAAEVLVVELRESQDAGPSLTFHNVKDGSSKLVGMSKGSALACELSPQEKLVKTYDRATGTLTLYGLDGSLILRTQVAELFGVKPWAIKWLPSQDQLVAHYHTPKFVESRYVDLEGRLGPQTVPFVEFDLGDARFPLRPIMRLSDVGEITPVKELWLANEELRPAQLPTPLPPELALLPKYDEAFVASSIEQAVMPADSRFMAYIHRGAVVVSEIIKTSKMVLDRLRADEERDLLLEAAAECGLAVRCYIADSGGAMPDHTKSISSQISPYLEDASLSDRFIYNFHLSSLSSPSDPKQVEIGFIESQQGRAVVYADGHVEWHSAPVR